MRYPPAGERENPYYTVANAAKEDIMNIYFLQNLATGRFLGDEHEPEFERSFFSNYETAKEAAWFRNQHKDLTTRDKWVVSIKEMNCPIMYVKYNDGLRHFFDVREAIKFYEVHTSAYEIGYFKDETHPLDLTRDWKWTDNYVIAKHFDDSFWDSAFRGDFIEDPGKKFNAYYYKKTIYTSIGKISLCGDMLEQYRLEKALKEKSVLLDDNGIQLTVKEEFPHLYHDFGGSYTAHYLSLWYPNGRLFGYTSLR
jgi:hypothetical protein